jgi:hypothetical protein
MLTAYFQENRLDERARGILYNDFPEWYTWQPRNKKVAKKEAGI